MTWTRLRQMFGGTKQAQAMAIPASGTSAVDIISRPLAMASAPTVQVTAATLDGASIIAASYAANRFGMCVLDQAAAFPLDAEGHLVDTVESAWHFGFWSEKSGPDWPRSYVSLRTEPKGSPDAREHDGFSADPQTVRSLELYRCMKPAQAIKAAIKAGLVSSDDAVYHVVYFAPSEGQPAVARISSHRNGQEMDHRSMCPYSGKSLPPPLKAKKGRPILTR